MRKKVVKKEVEKEAQVISREDWALARLQELGQQSQGYGADLRMLGGEALGLVLELVREDIRDAFRSIKK